MMRRIEFEDIKAKAKSWLVANGLDLPKDAAGYRTVIKELGKYLAATVFLTKNPRWVMDLPVVAGHDSTEDMQWRTMFDERLTFPIDALPMEIKEYLQCGSMRWAIADVFYRCTGQVWVYENPNAETKAGKKAGEYISCGMVLAARSQWKYYQKSTKKNGKHQWQCLYCENNWRRQKNGSRFVSIFDGTHSLQLILDEPPEAEFTCWQKERIQFYMRLEPNAAPRDEIPDIPCPPGTHRMAFEGKVSDHIWRVLYTNPGSEAMLQLEALARKAVEKSESASMSFGIRT